MSATGAPAFLVDNFFSSSQYTSLALAGDEEASGHEAWRVADGRRSSLDYWAATTANTQHTLTADLGASHAATMIALDRGHNLAGVAGVKLQYSSDNFSADSHDVLSVTIASAASDDTSLEATNGCVTAEGAWLMRFASASARYWRFLVPALGAGIVPQVVGLWVGQSWEPGGIGFPFDEDSLSPMAEVAETPWGWQGTGIVTRRRAGNFLIQLSPSSYATAATHFRDNWGKRRPMWIVPQDTRAERAVLADWPLGTVQGFAHDSALRGATLQWVEREPLVGA